jgi:carboxymethylenebutenolidase
LSTRGVNGSVAPIMTLRETEHVEIPTPSGPMRTAVFAPAESGRWPGVVLFSEIFQITAPIRRLAALLAGHGFRVAVPEVYHEFLPAGTVLGYDQAGADEGNRLKYAKALASYDADAAAALRWLCDHADGNGRAGSFGVCLGGHLALRAGLHPACAAAVCFYATDVHTSALGEGRQDDTLARLGELRGEAMFVWGRRDPHVPFEGRVKIRAALELTEARFAWHEVEAAHAFLRDEGHRYDSELAHQYLGLALALLRRRLAG